MKYFSDLPNPEVAISVSMNATAGEQLVLTCTVRVVEHLISVPSVAIEWSGGSVGRGDGVIESNTTYNGVTSKKTLTFITGYGSTLYIGIAMVFVFSPYIWKFTSCFQFQVNLTFNDFTAQNMSKVICVPNVSLNYPFLAKL